MESKQLHEFLDELARITEPTPPGLRVRIGRKVFSGTKEHEPKKISYILPHLQLPVKRTSSSSLLRLVMIHAQARSVVREKLSLSISDNPFPSEIGTAISRLEQAKTLLSESTRCPSSMRLIGENEGDDRSVISSSSGNSSHFRQRCITAPCEERETLAKTYTYCVLGKTNKQFEYDVFLSHSAPDKSVARDLAYRLNADGLHVWRDEWEDRAGNMITKRIDEALEHSRVILCVMSRHTSESRWTAFETIMSRWQDPTSKDRIFIPLCLDDAPIRDSLRQFSCVDWRQKTEDEYTRLLAACQVPAIPRKSHASLAKHTFSFGPTVSVWNKARRPDGCRILFAPFGDRSEAMTSTIGKRLSLQQRLSQIQEENSVLPLQNLFQDVMITGSAVRTIAHEIKELLTPLANYATLALHNLDDAEMTRKALDRTVRNCQRVSGIVASMFAMANGIEQLRRPVNVKMLVEETLASLSQDWDRDGITVRTDIPDDVHIDCEPMQIKQVLMNLFVNARDAMLPEGGELKLTTAVDAKHVEIVVSDTGRCISPEHLGCIFSPFPRIRTETAHSDGSRFGMGLSFCKRIVDAHGGEIDVTSHVNQGTTFTIRLPLRDVQE